VAERTFHGGLNQAGLSVTLPYLEDLTRRWEDAGGVQSSPLWEQGHELAGHIIENWAGRHGGHDNTPGSAARLLTALTRLADTESIAAFLARLAEGGGFVKGDTGALVEAALPKAAGLSRATLAPWSRRPAFWRLNRPPR
jgi:hypothetical protein